MMKRFVNEPNFHDLFLSSFLSTTSIFAFFETPLLNKYLNSKSVIGKQILLFQLLTPEDFLLGRVDEKLKIRERKLEEAKENRFEVRNVN